MTADPDKRRTSLEVDITLAMTTVRAARRAWARCPSPDNLQRETDAQAELDNLLDLHARLFGHEALAETMVRP